MDRNKLISIIGSGLVALGMSLVPYGTSRGGEGIPRDNSVYNVLKEKGKVDFEKQKELAGFDRLPVINRKNLDSLVESGHLVPMAEETNRYVLDGFPRRLEVTTPWTKFLLEQISRDYNEESGERLRINSLSRTAEYQNRIEDEGYIYAVPPSQSGHVRGISADISHRWMRLKDKRWLRNRLDELQDAQVLSFIDEPEEHIFHIMAFNERIVASYYKEKTGLPGRSFQDYFTRVVYAGTQSGPSLSD